MCVFLQFSLVYSNTGLILLLNGPRPLPNSRSSCPPFSFLKYHTTCADQPTPLNSLRITIRHKTDKLQVRFISRPNLVADMFLARKLTPALTKPNRQVSVALPYFRGTARFCFRLHMRKKWHDTARLSQRYRWRFKPPELLRHVECEVSPDFWKTRSAFIFMVKHLKKVCLPDDRAQYPRSTLMFDLTVASHTHTHTDKRTIGTET